MGAAVIYKLQEIDDRIVPVEGSGGGWYTRQGELVSSAGTLNHIVPNQITATLSLEPRSLRYFPRPFGDDLVVTGPDTAVLWDLARDNKTLINPELNSCVATFLHKGVLALWDDGYHNPWVLWTPASGTVRRKEAVAGIISDPKTGIFGLCTCVGEGPDSSHDTYEVQLQKLRGSNYAPFLPKFRVEGYPRDMVNVGVAGRIATDRRNLYDFSGKLLQTNVAPNTLVSNSHGFHWVQGNKVQHERLNRAVTPMEF